MTHPNGSIKRGKLPGSQSLWDFRSTAQPTLNAEHRIKTIFMKNMTARFPAGIKEWLMLGGWGLDFILYEVWVWFGVIFMCGHKRDAKAWTSWKCLLSGGKLMPEVL